jgi:hypothetical protein
MKNVASAHEFICEQWERLVGVRYRNIEHGRAELPEDLQLGLVVREGEVRRQRNRFHHVHLHAGIRQRLCRGAAHSRVVVQPRDRAAEVDRNDSRVDRHTLAVEVGGEIDDLRRGQTDRGQLPQ